MTSEPKPITRLAGGTSSLKAEVIPEATPAPMLREALEHAARLLAKSLPDEVLESMREEWGHTNVAVIQHWRDGVLAALRASVPNSEATPAPALREALERLREASIRAHNECDYYVHGDKHCKSWDECNDSECCTDREFVEAALRASAPTPAPALREALDKAKALVVHWTTFRDGFHGLDPMPQEAQEQYPEWGWYRAKDVKAFVAEVEAALRASEAS